MMALPLCVDLDETLIECDLFYSGMQTLACRKPWLLPMLMLKLAQGRPAAKAWLANLLPVEPANLPYRTQLVAYLKKQKEAGRKLYLVSASNDISVKNIAAYLGLFDGAFGSGPAHNLKGKNKAAFIQKHIAADFVYAGDSFADFMVWRQARAAILCGKARVFAEKMPIPVEATFH